MSTYALKDPSLASLNLQKKRLKSSTNQAYSKHSKKVAGVNNLIKTSNAAVAAKVKNNGGSDYDATIVQGGSNQDLPSSLERNDSSAMLPKQIQQNNHRDSALLGEIKVNLNKDETGAVDNRSEN